MGIELGLTPDSRWDVALDELAAATAGAGFTSLGLGLPRIDESTAGVLRDHHLRCGELLVLQVSDDADATLARAERLATAAALVEAEWVLTILTVGLDEGTARLVERCAAVVADAGARLAVEFTPICPIDSIALGLEVVEAAGHGAGVLVDTWHVERGPSTWDDLARLPIEQIAYVQFDDAAPPVSDDLMAETMNRRRLPGDGAFDLDRFATTLLERGWEGLVAAEVLIDPLDVPLPEHIQSIHDATARYWR